MPLPVSSYRQRLEDMTAEALDEYYRHAAGLKPTLEIAAIYDRYADLSTLEQVHALAEAGAHRELRRFAAEAFVGNGVKHLSEQAANTESELELDWDGGRLPYRAVRPAIMNEPDSSRRRDLYARRCAATDEHLNPILRKAAEQERELTVQVGSPSVLALYEGFGYDPAGLHRHTQAFLAETEDLYRERIDAMLRDRLGMGLDDASPADMVRLFRAPEFDNGFRAEQAVPALRSTLAGLGVDLDAQHNVELDVDARPTKRPRAFCAPIRVPDRVVLVILPQGGQDDYRALFHEAGHTEHFAHTSRDLPAEQRILGDNAVTEGFAFLMEHLVSDRGWLSARLDFGPIDSYVEFVALSKLYFVRRYAAKLAYELELHGGAPLDSMPARYAELLTAAVGVPYSTTDYLEDVDGGFYCTCYLRAWAFEAQLAENMREQFGRDWYGRRAAGSLVRELWSMGQAQTAEELLADVTGQRLDFGVLADEARAALG
ncbi:MAG: hypothetical protein ACTHNU_14185 [Gaiellales bacterium]